jgi:hypothetical protein
MASTIETVFIEKYLFFLLVGTRANSSWGPPFRVMPQLCPPQFLRVRWVAAWSFEKEACRPHATPQLSALAACPDICAPNAALPMRRIRLKCGC